MAGLAATRARGRRGGRPGKLTPELRRQAEAMLRDRKDYPFVSDVVRNLSIGRTAFYHHAIITFRKIGSESSRTEGTKGRRT